MIMGDLTTTEFSLVLEQEAFFKSALTESHVSWEKESQFAIQQLQKNKFLYDTAIKNKTSLQNAIINVSAIGISLNPANKHAYLVPRDSMVCLDISYMGIMHLARQSGSIEWGQAKLVYKNDTYRNAGIDKAPIHEQATFGDKGEIIGVYCTVKLASGDYLTEEMDIAAINKIQETSKAKNGPWKTFREEMIRKTVVKRASKYWPSCDRVHNAVAVVNEHEGLTDEFIQTAPKLSEHTSEQKIYFDQLISNDDAIGMFLFQQSTKETTFNDLYHSFEKGTKGKYQAIVDGLTKKGRDDLGYYYKAFIGCAGDDLGTAELISEVSIEALNFIINQVDIETASFIKKQSGI